MSLIGGKDRKNERIYPLDWLCAHCKRPFGQHVQIGTPNEEGYGADRAASSNWCFSKRSDGYMEYASKYFKAVDNLTYVEMKAKGKVLC
jgi:hypothetical protein